MLRRELREHRPAGRVSRAASRLLVSILVLLQVAAPAAAAARSGAEPAVPEVDILELSPAMARFLVRHVSPRQAPDARVLSLMDAILNRKKLGIVYEGTGTKTAIETFRTRRGNCLSFTILFVAMARHLGLAAYFHEVAEVISWDRRGEAIVRNQHMMVEVEVENGRRRVDFLPGAEKRYRAVRRISDLRALAHYYNNLGVDTLAAGDAALARAFFLRALEADATLSYGWTHLGVAHRRLGDFAAAERGHLRALEIDRNEPAALGNLASLYLAWGRDREAQPLLRRVEDHLRRNPFHHFRLGVASARGGELQQAKAHFREAVRRMPEEADFHAALAETLARAGDPRRARESYEKAMALADDEVDRRALREAIAALPGALPPR